MEGQHASFTIVVQTNDSHAKTCIEHDGTPKNDKVHVTERLRMSEDGKKLENLLASDDPGTVNQRLQALRQVMCT